MTRDAPTRPRAVRSASQPLVESASMSRALVALALSYEVDCLTHKRHSENFDEPEYLVRWAGLDVNGNKWLSTWRIASVIGDASIAGYEASHAQPEHEEIDVDTTAEASPEPGPSTINTFHAPALPATSAVQAKMKKNAKHKEKQEVMKSSVQDDNCMWSVLEEGQDKQKKGKGKEKKKAKRSAEPRYNVFDHVRRKDGLGIGKDKFKLGVTQRRLAGYPGIPDLAMPDVPGFSSLRLHETQAHGRIDIEAAPGAQIGSY